MQKSIAEFSRRKFLALTDAAAASTLFPGRFAWAQDGSPPGEMLMRAIPSSGQAIPAIGMGTWITFNVGASDRLRADRAKVLQTFFDLGGGMVDSSPIRTYRKADGNEVEETTFVDIDAFGRTAENILKYCKKGDPLMVEGRLRFQSWETEAGDKRSKLTFMLETFQFLPRSGGGNEGAGSGSAESDDPY